MDTKKLLNMFDKLEKTLRSIHQDNLAMWDRVRFLQMSVDVLEQRLTHVEDNMEIEIDSDFDLDGWQED